MVFAAGLALTLSCTAYADETTFVPGTSVNGLGISNMTVDQATQRIADFYASDYKLTIKEKGGKTESSPVRRLAILWDCQRGICSRSWISRIRPDGSPARMWTTSTVLI